MKIRYTAITGMLLFTACFICACYAQRFRDRPTKQEPILPVVEEVIPTSSPPVVNVKMFESDIITYNGVDYIVVYNSNGISITPALTK